MSHARGPLGQCYGPSPLQSLDFFIRMKERTN
ncbi:hypothetical protein COLO4_11243 [Corchorus olitorius]|uniref:Uncharacterized protein n=1 Tax=Corchorus olitorius TaxID=93759 RepID=A0A1R3K5K3_9ROSI|nr:hypothetical protein COLO4_11243 [Corchorus olitorius]